jgi:HTH-type transcriptional regulator / antitoxin HigA
MKATLVIVENDWDHPQAKALVEKLMGSTDPSDQARLIAQARLMEACEQSRWPSRVSGIVTGKRELSVSMVRKVRDLFHVSADVLTRA